MTLPRSLDDLRGLRAARWVRESTRGQFDNFGPDAQRDQQDRMIERHGLVDTGIGWQVAHSGRTIATTEEFAEMLSRAGRDFDVLVVGYVSRFTRNLHTAVNARHDLHASGAVLLFCNERVLSSEEDSWDQWARETVESEAGSRRLGRDIRAGYEAKFRTMGDQAGNAPLGFRRDGSAHTLTIDPATIGQAVDVFERYATGTVTIDQVADATGLAPDRVRSMLANPIYNGFVRRYRRSPREERLPAPWRADPPVSDALWQGVQDALRSRVRGVGAPRHRKRLDPLSGLLYCRCGRRLRANGVTGSPPAPRRYHPGRCTEWGPRQSVWSATHDDAIAAQLGTVKLDDITMERVVRALRDDDAPVPQSIDIARLERQKRDLALDHAAGRIEDASYLERMAELRRIAPPSSRALGIPAEEAVAWLRNLTALWNAAGISDEARAEIIRAVYDRIEVTGAGFVKAYLAPHAYRFGMALALPEAVSVRVKARPAGFEPAA